MKAQVVESNSLNTSLKQCTNDLGIDFNKSGVPQMPSVNKLIFRELWCKDRGFRNGLMLGGNLGTLPPRHKLGA